MTPRGRHAIIIHAHFYQPPREDPWLDLMPRQPGAAPFHDWNERIEQECYRAVVAARLPGPDGRTRRVINCLESISFNAGPTLCEWLEHHAPDTYAQFLMADRVSAERLGHGNALAQPYHHTILPLASRRDKRTEVRWGIADFRRRFAREPEGMWLPETALDDETLDVLAEAGIRFTIVAPSQLMDAPPRGMPGLYTTSAGRAITLVPYDGEISHQVAFGPLIRNGDAWRAALTGRHPGGAGAVLTTVATDGETYGHHHAYGEMALAALIDSAERNSLHLDNAASFLARHPATAPVAIVAPSSWSCAHGVERWRADCGCRMEPATFPSQAWRAPLRESLDWLASELHAHFEREGSFLLGDVWEARDAMDGLPASPYLLPAARQLLEMERNALRMFTSCGWFFDDLAGIETLQCLSYAARAIELAGPPREALLDSFGARLAAARSNDPAAGTGRDLLLSRAVPTLPAVIRAAAGHVAAELFPWGVVDRVSGVWDAESQEDGQLRVTDTRTGTSHLADGEILRDPDGRLVVRLRLDGGDREWTVRLAELPEPARAVVRAALVNALFPAELTARLYELGVTTRAAVAARLQELLPGDLDMPSVDPALLHGALDLLDLEAESVPFDAQTRFWRVMKDGAPPVREALSPFIPRFGFAADAFTPPTA